MKKAYRYFLIFLAFSLLSTLHAQQEEQAFDFWVSQWDVHWFGPDSTRVNGTNHIEKILDGKVLQEHFEDPADGFRGTSLSVYNSQQATWYQSWADNGGGYFHFEGDTSNGNRIFSMTEEDSRGVLYRMVFSDITPDSLTWTWEGTRDGGKTWKTAWIIYYERKDMP